MSASLSNVFNVLNEIEYLDNYETANEIDEMALYTMKFRRTMKDKEWYDFQLDIDKLAKKLNRKPTDIFVDLTVTANKIKNDLIENGFDFYGVNPSVKNNTIH